MRSHLQWQIISGILAICGCSAAIAQCERAYLRDPNANYQTSLGWDVDAHGRDIVLGCPGRHASFQGSGILWHLIRTDSANWQLHRLFPPDDSTLLLGFSVAMGDGFVTGGHYGAIVVDVFDHQHGTVTQLTAPDINPNSFFGVAMDASGADRLVVGADAGAGAAYVYYRDSATGAWTYIQKLVAADPRGNSFFGSAVSIDGDTVVVGARQDDDQGFASGSAYVFELQPDGTWIQTAKLLASDGSSFWQFGTTVSASGEVIVVGAPPAESAGPVAGAAYVFEKDAGSGMWFEIQHLTEPVPFNSNKFGASVAIDGDLMLIGAENASYNGARTGAAYVYHRQANGSWREVGTIGPGTNPQFNMEFGSRVALSGHTAVVGAYSYDHRRPNDYFDGGAAYVFAVGPDADGNGLMDVCECVGDTNGDYVVSLVDLSVQLAHYGTPGGAARADGDFDADGDVDLADVASLLAHFGEECW